MLLVSSLRPLIARLWNIQRGLICLPNVSVFQAGIAHSNRVAIISQQGSFTYAQLIQDVHLLTKRLTEDHR